LASDRRRTSAEEKGSAAGATCLVVRKRRGEEREREGEGKEGRERRKLRAARRALGKRQAQDERIETCADGLQGSDGRRGEEKRGE